MSEFDIPRALFPAYEDRTTIDTWLTDRLCAALQNVSAGQVLPDIELEAFRKELASTTFEKAKAVEDVLEWTIASLESGIVQTTHPGYFGLFNPAPSFPAECADRIAAAFNPQIAVWSHAPVAADIENHVLNHVARRAGMADNASGHFTSGGSEANATAFFCALTAAESGFADVGARAFQGQPRIYVSGESHLAWLKIAHQSGIGRQAIRLVVTDGQGRMDANALEKEIQTDLEAGDIPVMIAATAGTTNAGMIDPLIACADIARKHATWYHVDAAWGGALMASDRERHLLDGMGRADSITIDAHKWFAVTMGAGMFLTHRTDVVADTFRVSTDYMPSNNQATDAYVNSMQWSRRFTGLRLFLSLAAAGWNGYAAHIEHSIDLIDYLNAEMMDRGWIIANRSRMAVSCLVPPAHIGTAQEIVNRVVEKGEQWLSLTRYEGQPVVRICLCNGRTTRKDMDRLIESLSN